MQKWTGSTTLGARFTEDVLADPKSFTRRDFSQLQARYDEISNILRSATPQISEPSSPSSDEQPFPGSSRPSTSRRSDFEPLPPPKIAEPVKYWNEYDDGSECGGGEDDYAIYINPDDDTGFPGLHYVQTAIQTSFAKAKGWLHIKQTPERRALLAANHSPASYSSTAVNSDSDEDGYASSEGYPASGYNAHYALPSLSLQQVARYRERVFFWGTVSCFAVSFILLTIAGILISTGKHKLRVEVDAGVTVGVVASHFSACAGLGLTMYRRDPLSLMHWLVVWTTFTATCLLNGMLLILVVGNSP